MEFKHTVCIHCEYPFNYYATEPSAECPSCGQQTPVEVCAEHVPEEMPIPSEEGAE